MSSFTGISSMVRHSYSLLRFSTLIFSSLIGEVRTMFDQEAKRAAYIDAFFRQYPNIAISWIRDIERAGYGSAASALLDDAQTATNLEAKHVSGPLRMQSRSWSCILTLVHSSCSVLENCHIWRRLKIQICRRMSPQWTVWPFRVVHRRVFWSLKNSSVPPRSWFRQRTRTSFGRIPFSSCASSVSTVYRRTSWNNPEGTGRKPCGKNVVCTCKLHALLKL